MLHYHVILRLAFRVTPSALYCIAFDISFDPRCIMLYCGWHFVWSQLHHVVLRLTFRLVPGASCCIVFDRSCDPRCMNRLAKVCARYLGAHRGFSIGIEDVTPSIEVRLNALCFLFCFPLSTFPRLLSLSLFFSPFPLFSDF